MSTQTHRFRFTGTGAEYFRIWIVNTALTLLTLGIYSAWAKVRKKRYFYGNTLVDNAAFDYHATPVQILKGRVIAMAFLIAYLASGHFSPALHAGLNVALLLMLPWLVVRSLTFNARNSSHRGLRFNFHGGVGEAVALYIGWPLVIVFSLGLAYPYFAYRKAAFWIENHSYGRERVSLADLGPRNFYGVYLRALLIALLPVAIAIAMLALVVAAAPHSAHGEPPRMERMRMLELLAFLLFAILVPALQAPAAYVEAGVSNLVFNHARLGEVRFLSELRARELIWIRVSNALAIAFSIGLAVPWARVRLVRYRMDHLALLTDGEFGHFVADQADQIRATGEEIADVMDIDVGF
jgi:uncharacterized membrane protein YjgN (DUF898 family)